MTRFTALPTSASAICVLLLIVNNGFGHGMIPHDVPVERLVANLEQYIKEHPDDPEGYYRLGRVHTLSLETKSEFVLAFDVREGEPARPAEGYWAHRQVGAKQQAPPSSTEQAAAHLKHAIVALNRAIELRPTEARFRLTLACALEAGEPMMTGVDVWPLLPTSAAAEEATYYREQVEASAKDAAIVDQLIRLMREDHWVGNVRDIVMTLVYARRDRQEFKDTAQRLRAADWHEQIEEQFFTAMCYALPVNGKASKKPMWGGMENWVSYEAGKDFVRVVDATLSFN